VSRLSARLDRLAERLHVAEEPEAIRYQLWELRDGAMYCPETNQWLSCEEFDACKPFMLDLAADQAPTF